MKKNSNKILTLVFTLSIFLVMTSYLISGDRSFSENENRYLQGKPKFSLDRVLKGQFTKNVEKYMDDQFLLRDKFIEIKTASMKMFGKKDINGVYLADDNYLIEKCTEEEFDYDNLNKNLDKIEDFSKKYEDKDISVLIAPTSSLILKDKLPKNASVFNQNKALDMVEDKLQTSNFIDIRKTLEKNSKKELYYKTDHHWTSLGAFYAYQEWAKENEIFKDINNYHIRTVTDDFYGSLYSKVLDKDTKADKIQIFDKKEDLDHKISLNFNKKEMDSIYDMDKLKEKDKYLLFFGGNQTEMTIETEADNNKHLLIIKDSFANSFIPFILDDFKTISVIDPRYFKEDLKSYIDGKDISDIMFLYNIMNLSNDKSLEKTIDI